MQMPKQSIRLNGQWVAFSVNEMTKLAGSAPTLQERIQWAASARQNLYGHAPFRPGELLKLLGNPSARGLRRALAVAKKQGRVAPESTLECLVPDRRLTTRGLGRSGTCHEAGHEDLRYMSWTPGVGWFRWAENKPTMDEAELWLQKHGMTLGEVYELPVEEQSVPA